MKYLKKEIKLPLSRKQALLATLATAGVFFGILALVGKLTRLGKLTRQ